MKDKYVKALKDAGLDLPKPKVKKPKKKKEEAD